MAAPTSNDVPGWESFSFDSVSAAGLQNVDVVVDADATVQSESNSSSAASADNVTGNSGASSLTSFNSGIQADEAGTNTFDVSADAGLQGLAGTTAASSTDMIERVGEMTWRTLWGFDNTCLEVRANAALSVDRTPC